MSLQIDRLRQDFPALSKQSRAPLVYLDNASTTQKPRIVLDRMRDFYENHCANIHRANYLLAHEATQLWDKSRDVIRRFVGAADLGEIIFTKNATEALNLAAHSLCTQLSPGDMVVVSSLEHHSNFVPWQQLSLRFGLTLRVVHVTPDGMLDLQEFEAAMSLQPRIVALTHCSHVFGSILPIEQLTQRAKRAGATVVIDGTQMVPHRRVQLDQLECDLYAFSGHKMLGPMGVGCLYGKKALLESMPPWIFGGDMVYEVNESSSTFQYAPRKFEAGTQSVADVVGLAAAAEYLTSLDMQAVETHERALLNYCLDSLSELPGVRLHGPKNRDHRSAIVSFEVEGIHPHDVSGVLGSLNICVRSGQHCAQPLLRQLGLEGITRVSMYIYNNNQDIDRLIAGIRKAQSLFL